MEEELCHGGFMSGEGSDVEEDDITKVGNQSVPKYTGMKCLPNPISRPIFLDPVSHSSAARDRAAVAFVHRPKVEKKVPNVAEYLLLKGSVDCPKLELLKFNGDPMSYHRFILTFTSTVEGTVWENRRLLYLLQYCEGNAKKLIEHCALLDPKEGYKKAKEILFENFGRKNVIA